MRLIVLDTNVVVSAGIHASGPPAKIVLDWVLRGKVHVATSPDICLEYREVVRRSKFYNYNFPPLWLEYLIEESTRISDPTLWRYPCPDARDTKFLALAHATGAWLITGYMKHFPESIRNGVVVKPPADYLRHLTGDSDSM